MEFSWWQELYAQLGAAHPRISLVAVMLLSALLAGGCWTLIEKSYERQVEENRDRPAISEVDQQRLSELESRVAQIDKDVKAREDRAEQARKLNFENRQKVAACLTAGTSIREQTNTVEEQTKLEQTALQWERQTRQVLSEIDQAYAARFVSASGPSYGRSVGGQPLPKLNENIWNFVNVRTEVLAQILGTMPN